MPITGSAFMVFLNKAFGAGGVWRPADGDAQIRLMPFAFDFKANMNAGSLLLIACKLASRHPRSSLVPTQFASGTSTCCDVSLMDKLLTDLLITRFRIPAATSINLH